MAYSSLSLSVSATGEDLLGWSWPASVNNNGDGDGNVDDGPARGTEEMEQKHPWPGYSSLGLSVSAIGEDLLGWS